MIPGPQHIVSLRLARYKVFSRSARTFCFPLLGYFPSLCPRNSTGSEGHGPQNTNVTFTQQAPAMERIKATVLYLVTVTCWISCEAHHRCYTSTQDTGGVKSQDVALFTAPALDQCHQTAGANECIITYANRDDASPHRSEVFWTQVSLWSVSWPRTDWL